MNYPLLNPVITQGFGENPAAYARFGFPGHNGIDLWTDLNPPRVLAIEAGVVLKVGWEEGGYGKYVVLNHTLLLRSKKLLGWQSYYAHLDNIVVVPGQIVAPGQALGVMGSTGNSSGPHLHLGVRFAASFNPLYKGYVDPLPLLQGAAMPPASPASPLAQAQAETAAVSADMTAASPAAAANETGAAAVPAPGQPSGGVPAKPPAPAPALVVSSRNKTVYRQKRIS